MDIEIERFHAHLDVCKRCREQPFNLCDVGEKLLIAASLAKVAKRREKAKENP